MLLSWPPHRGERTSDAQTGSDERVPARAVPPLSSRLASSTHSTAPLDRTLKAKRRGVRAPQRHSHHAGHLERDRVHRAEDLELPGCLCWAPVRRKVEAPKIQHPPLLLGYLQENPQMAAGEFSADRDTKATL